MQPHVSLRRVTRADAEQVAKWRAEPSSRRFQPLRQLPLAELRELLALRGIERLSPNGYGEFQWIVETPDGDGGWVTLSISSREHDVAAVGYTIAERLRGRGYARAAVRAVLPLAFALDSLALFRLEAVAALDNTASRRVLEGNGFQYEGIVRSFLLIDGIRVDHARYALLRPEWERDQNDASVEVSVTR